MKKPPTLPELAKQLSALDGASDDSLVRMVSDVQHNIEDVLGGLLAQLPGRPAGKGHVFCYGRQSKDDTVQIHTQAGQIHEFQDYHKRKLADLELRWPPFFDIGVSGGVPLFRRPAGSKLNEFLRRGDHLIITKLDRGFRSKLDGWRTVKSFHDRGISVHIINMGLDMSTPVGKVMFSILLTFAEFEREMISDRTKEGLAVRKRLGLKRCAWFRPYGWKWTGKASNKTKKLVPDIDERKFAEHLMERLSHFKSIENVTELIKYEGHVNPNTGKPYTKFSVRERIYALWLGFPQCQNREMYRGVKNVGIKLGEQVVGYSDLDEPVSVNGHASYASVAHQSDDQTNQSPGAATDSESPEINPLETSLPPVAQQPAV